MTNQGKRIMAYINEHGSISPQEAFVHLGITKLATRISEMRKLGIEFRKVYCTGKNKYGEPTHFMRYSLKG